MRHTYKTTIAGLERELPICKVTDDLYIGAFICFGDAEITVACARELLKLVPMADYDYMLTAEAKSIPCPRDGPSVRRGQIFHRPQGSQGIYARSHPVEDQSITTAGARSCILAGTTRT